MTLGTSTPDADPLLRLVRGKLVRGLVDEAGDPDRLLLLELPEGVVAEIDDGTLR